MRIPRILRPRAIKARKRRRSLHYFADAPVTWEAYISGRAAQRNRNIDLFKETGRQLSLGLKSMSDTMEPVRKATDEIARRRDEH